MNFSRSLQLHSSRRRGVDLLQREDTLNISPILNETSMFKTFNDTSLRQVLDESTIIVPKSAGGGLTEAFFDIIQTCRQSDVIDTLNNLGQACTDSLECVEPWNRCNIYNYWLAEEANTWRLFQCLYSDSLQEPGNALDNIHTEPVLSQQTLVNALFKSDSELRLLQLLVDWLEASAAYQEEHTKSSAPVLNNNVHWGNTLHELLLGSSLFNKEKSKSMVTCIDPDAPRRQKRAIHSDDQQDDKDLCKRIFKEVRCGKFNEAMSLCAAAGQPWRGAVLQGWRLLHYPPRSDPSEPLRIVGNPSRDLWKLCSLGIANNITENIHYRATVGILCGHLGSALPACQGSWEDLLWAHLRVQIEMRVDRFLREHHSTVFANTTPTQVLDLLLAEHKPEELSLQQVFGAVNALLDGKKETYYQACQKYLMLGHISALMEEALHWLDTAEERFVRFMAHLVLVLRHIGKDPKHDIGDKILETYVAQLIERKADGTVEFPELIAYYTSTVPSDKQILLYAELMDRVNKSDCREQVIKAGTSAGVDVSSAAALAINNAITAVQQGYGNIDMTFSQTNAIEKDKSLVNRVIMSLEWYSFISNREEEVLWLSNSMIRTFIFIGNTDAAAATLVKLNQLFPSIAKKVESTSSELREHLCLKAYLEALDGFASWYRHYISGQPKDVEPLPGDASFTDKVHHEQRCQQVSQQKTRWANAILHQSRHTKNLLYNVLLFPGGWLQDQHDGTLSAKFTEDESKERSKQLETLRKLCIPETAILILRVLQSGTDVESHGEAIRLSDLIAAENRCLYKVFTKDKLIELLHRITESSLFVLEKGLDPFGYKTDDE